jgi:hypothetical protein
MTKDLGNHRQAKMLEEIFSKLLESVLKEIFMLAGRGRAFDDHHMTFRTR